MLRTSVASDLPGVQRTHCCDNPLPPTLISTHTCTVIYTQRESDTCMTHGRLFTHKWRETHTFARQHWTGHLLKPTQALIHLYILNCIIFTSINILRSATIKISVTCEIIQILVTPFFLFFFLPSMSFMLHYVKVKLGEIKKRSAVKVQSAEPAEKLPLANQIH